VNSRKTSLLVHYNYWEGFMTSFTNRIIRAAKLDANLYEEVEADKQAMPQAITVVVLSSLIRVLAIIPGLAALVHLAAMVWMLVAMVIAVRQALDYTSTWRAVGVCCIGWVIQMLIIMLLFSVFGGPPQPAGI
jgi:RsiW-degrading membrane proteinase PrsW (M82 family)